VKIAAYVLIFITMTGIVGGSVSFAQHPEATAPVSRSMADSLNMRLIGRWANGPCVGADVAGTIAYFGNGAYLEVVDFSNPAHPVELGRILLPSAVMGVDVSGNFAYVANNFAGLRIIDVSDPANPWEVATLRTEDQSLKVFIKGNFAYLADGWGGLRIIDVSNPAAPHQIGAYQGVHPTREVVVNGNFAYLANDRDGLLVVDVSNPSQPGRVGAFQTGNEAYGVAVAGTHVYLADRFNGLRIIDVANPYNPTEIGFYDTDGIARAVAVQGTFAFLADDYQGLKVIDVSNPYSPHRVGSLATRGFAYDVSRSGNYVFLADYHNGLRMIDVSNFYQPVEIGHFDTDGNSKGVAVKGKYAYIANAEAGLRILDISDPAMPVKIGQLNIPGFSHAVAVDGNYAYVAADSAGLYIIAVTDPTNPVQLSNYRGNFAANDLVIDGRYAYVADQGNGLTIIDVSDPSRPTLAGSVTLPEKRADGIAKKDSLVCLAAGNDGLRIVDVADPSQPVEIGWFDTGGAAISIDVKRYFAYVGTDQNELKIIDISNPAQLSLVGTFVLNDRPAGIYVNGKYVFIANDRQGVRVIDAFDLGAIQEAGYYGTGCRAYGEVTLYNDYVFLPDEMDGLYIMEFSGISQNAAPEVPALISVPDDAFINSATPQFSWTIPADPNGDPLHFTLEITSDSTWQTIDYRFDSGKSTAGFLPAAPAPPGSGSMSYTLSAPLSEQQWYWRVIAWDGVSYSDYSAPWRFTVDVTAPVLNSLTFENPGYGENWFNPTRDSTVTVVVSYDEINPRAAYLFCRFLTDTLINATLAAGVGQQTSFDIPIANKVAEKSLVVVRIDDKAANEDSIESELRLDPFPPFGYHSNAPDTVALGQIYDVQIFDARDNESGVATIFLDGSPNPYLMPASPRQTMPGINTPGVYFYRYFAEDFLGNQGEIKTDTTVVTYQTPILVVTDTIEIAGEDFWVDIQVGSEQQPVYDLLGVAFELNYTNTQFVDVVSPDSIVPGEFFGNDVIMLPHLDDANGRVSVGISRKKENGGVTGAGIVVRIKFTSAADTPDSTPVQFSFPMATANDTAGNAIDLVPAGKKIWIVQPFADFSMTVEPDSSAIRPGDSTRFRLSFTPLGAFDSPVSLTISGLTPRMEADYPAGAFTIPASFSVLFSTTGQIVPAIYHPVITATGGGVTHRDTITITVLPPEVIDFAMTVSPDSQAIYAGESTDFTLSFQPLGSFDASISLQLTNLPTGMTANYPAGFFSIPALFNITFNTTGEILPGVYHPVITATGGGISHQVTVTITVLERPDFIMTIVPDSQSVRVGESVQFQVSFEPVGGFNSSIVVTVSNIPSGMEAIFSSHPFQIPINFSIGFNVSDRTAPGNYYPIVTATGGGITHQDTLTVQVLPTAVVQQFGVLPNPFTPNGDGFNDRVEFRFPETLSGEAVILIFDVNGRKLRDIRDSRFWYGRDDAGRELQPGAYIYIVKSGTRVIAKGIISLAR